jgi:molybdopterin molybdotransferase
MDGYAVIAADLAEASSASPVTLEVLEELPGGVAPSRAIRSGQASRIMTGGMVPDGADAVVMLEMTATSGAGDRSFVTIGKSVAAGLNLAGIGSEIAESATLVQPGSAIGPGESALLAACGCASVAVAKRPRVAVLSTGSELLEVEEALAPAKIRNSNAPMLAALLREAGALPELLGKVPDDKGKAERLIRESMERCDLVVTTGGVSVGDYDIMADLVAESGQLLFNKVAMRPGSPTSAALLGGKPLIALSGNPSACFVGFHLFVRPALLAMQSARSCLPGSFQAFISVPYPKTNAYRRYLRGYTELRDGRVWVTPTGKDQSSLMTTIAGADCLIEIPAAKHGVEAGQLLTAWRLGRGE